MSVASRASRRALTVHTVALEQTLNYITLLWYAVYRTGHVGAGGQACLRCARVAHSCCDFDDAPLPNGRGYYASNALRRFHFRCSVFARCVDEGYRFCVARAHAGAARRGAK